jgi:ankyrin repeat protein
MIAIQGRRTELACGLIHIGANIDHISSVGESALNQAIMHDNLEVVKVLVEHGVNINSSGPIDHLPIYWAIFSPDSRILEYLLANGAAVPESLGG